jgi:tetratricopeptide (TPR) repeat protein
MQGLLGDKLFADLVRDLSRENATGSLTITRDGEAIEVFFECGIPTAATTTVSDEQMECRLVRDGLVGAEQIKAAWLAARESSRTLDAVLVQDGMVPAAAMEQAQREASLQALNLAFEWYTGDYNFDPVSCPRAGAKLALTPAECILKGARHASASDAILDRVAPDHRIIEPAREGGGSMERSATLSSVEGYVLSCIQSPISIGETSGLTGLAHSETRRAVFVLILLGLLTERQSTPDHQVVCQQRSSSEQNRAEQLSPVVEWCPVEYVSGDGGFQHQYSAPSGVAAPNDYYDDQEELDGDSPARQESEISVESGASDGREDPMEDWAVVRSRGESEDPDRDESEITCMADSSAIPDGTPGGAEDNSQIEHSYPAMTTPIAEGPRDKISTGMMTSEEAAYQERLFLEEKLGGMTVDVPLHESHVQETAAECNANLKPKSLTTAIQELSIRLRLARSAPPDPETPAASTRATAPEHSREQEQSAEPQHSEELEEAAEPRQSAEVEPPVEELPILQQPVTFDEPLRIGDPLAVSAAPLPPEDLIAPDSLVPLITPGSESAGNNRDAGPSAGAACVTAMSVLPGGATVPHRDSGGDERLLKKVIAKLDVRLAAATSSDYYQLLGIDRLASNGKITESYEEMVTLYGGYKTRWPEDTELQSKITELMSRIKQAYETIGDARRRRVYDLPMAKEQPRQITKTEPPKKIGPQPLQAKTDEPGQPAPRTVATQTASPFEPVNETGMPDRKKPSPPIASSLPRKSKRSPASPGGAEDFKPDLRNPYEAAEEYCKRGRALYERMDLHTAAHLFREAIKLDPNRATYHYQLGLVLSTLSQARKEHKHHKGCHVTCRLGGFLTRNQRVRREAERHLLKAAELDPSNAEIRLKLGTLYKEAALDQKAQQYFYEALMLDANCELAKLELGLDREPGREKPVEPGRKRPRRGSKRE